MQRRLGCLLEDPCRWVAVNGRIGGRCLLGDLVGPRFFLPTNFGLGDFFETFGLLRSVGVCLVRFGDLVLDFPWVPWLGSVVFGSVVFWLFVFGWF